MAQSRMTLQELTRQVERALTRDYPGQDNGQVREVPDARTIRYYTTLGLVDRPASFSGRTALYGRRHLLQIVAIKRLQTEGLRLAEVQERLLGLPDAALARIARVAPASGPDGEASAPEEAPPLPAIGFDRRPEPFWLATPALAMGPAPEAASLLVGIPVREDITLLVAASRPFEPADLEAVRDSLSPLFEVLEKRRLIVRRERQ